MTAREAVIQGYMELGTSREEAQLRVKLSDGCLPAAAVLTRGDVRPGQEREFIEFLKQFFRRMEENPAVWRALTGREIGKQAVRN